MRSPYKKMSFLLSVANVKQLPEDSGIEVAIVGRSNTGKSSVINRLAQNKHLARVSKTPGRTQHINLFGLDEAKRLADLPGYGYAKVPLSVIQQWHHLVNQYLSNRACLKGLILVVDIRHPLKPLDLQLLNFCQGLPLPVHVLFNKADKLSKAAALKTVKDCTDILTGYGNSVTFQLFSAVKGTGIEAFHQLLNDWYEYK